jgi:hypothetical protein
MDPVDVIRRRPVICVAFAVTAACAIVAAWQRLADARGTRPPSVPAYAAPMSVTHVGPDGMVYESSEPGGIVGIPVSGSSGIDPIDRL